jgi:gas vesicle protein
VIGVLVGCIVGAVLGPLIADQIEQRDRAEQSQASLRTTRDYVATVSADLTALRHDVAVLETQVGSDTTALTQDASQLQGAQSALASAQTHVTQQATLITTLQSCLGGVEQALNALSVGNKNRAIELLDSVSSSCTSAAAASG